MISRIVKQLARHGQARRLLGVCCSFVLGFGAVSPLATAAEPESRALESSGTAIVTAGKVLRKSPEPRRGAPNSGSLTPESKAASVQAAPPAGKKEEPALLRGKEIYQRLLKSTAWVAVNRSGDWSKMSWGTGWLLDRDRKRVITNHHVISDGQAVFKDEMIRVYFPEYEEGNLLLDRDRYLAKAPWYKAKLFDSDSLRDLAVLELEDLPDSLEPLPLAAETITPGETVFQLGNPGASGAMWVFTSGSVRQVYRGQMVYDNGQLCDFLRVETQSPINPGDSGGPVVNERGELVAVTSGTSGAGQLMTYFVDVSEVKSYLEDIAALADPKTAEAFNERGDHYYGRGRYDRALADFAQAVRLNGRFAEAIANRGWTLYQLEDYDTAVADFDEAIRLEGAEPAYYQGRGIVYQAREDYDKSLADLTQAIRIAPDEAEYYGDRASLYASQENYSGAIKDYTRAIKLSPDTADYYNSRGDCHYFRDEFQEAAKDYSAAIERSPEEALYYYNRACAYHKKRDLDRAALDFQRMEQLNPQFAQEQVQTLKTRLLKLTNATDKPLTVWLKYHTLDEGDDWDWYPSAPGESQWLRYTFDPGESSYVSDDGFQIHADRVRVSAYNKDRSEVWEGYEKQDLILAGEEYEAYQMGTIEFTFR